jgi:asparagine synthase (glutamine-hydrolysing)
MCGIFACINTIGQPLTKEQLDFAKQRLEHRGPDCNGHIVINGENTCTTLLHTRLIINGDNSPQPLVSKDKNLVLIINGEIFNWKELEEDLGYRCTMSDCEIIFPLYEKHNNDLLTFFKHLQGQFSFVLYDKTAQRILVARDRVGVTPLYYAVGHDSITFASELKAFQCLQTVDSVDVFPPRHFLIIDTKGFSTHTHSSQLPFESYYDLDKFRDIVTKNSTEDTEARVLQSVKIGLQKSVALQLNDLLAAPDDKFGVLLSGGLDSSLIASLVCKEAMDFGLQPSQIKTFSIGVHANTPDLIAARKVAQFLGTDHTEFYFSIQEGLDSIRDVIQCIESFDCTTVRASTPMYLLVKKIKQKYPSIRVLFSGELSDEMFCYLYGANAPNDRAYQEEIVDLIKNVHKFDCLRANKTCMAYSVEVRVPFTDTTMIETCLGIHPKWKMFGEGRQPIEKKILRDAFVGFLPADILYRKKEQFSDGVSGFDGVKDNWIDALRKHAQELCMGASALAAEQELYRRVYEQVYGTLGVNTVEIWKPKWSNTDDPSGRVQNFWETN